MKNVNFFDLSLLLSKDKQWVGYSLHENRSNLRANRNAYTNICKRLRVKTLSLEDESVKHFYDLYGIYTTNKVNLTNEAITEQLALFRSSIEYFISRLRENKEFSLNEEETNFFIVDAQSYLIPDLQKIITEEYKAHPVYFYFARGSLVGLVCPTYPNFQQLLTKHQIS